MKWWVLCVYYTALPDQAGLKIFPKSPSYQRVLLCNYRFPTLIGCWLKKHDGNSETDNPRQHNDNVVKSRLFRKCSYPSLIHAMLEEIRGKKIALSLLVPPCGAFWSCRPGWHEDVKHPHSPAPLNQVISCQLGAYRATLLPGKMAFRATNYYFFMAWLPYWVGAFWLLSVVYLQRGLISRSLSLYAVNKIGTDLRLDRKRLFWGDKKKTRWSNAHDLRSPAN